MGYRRSGSFRGMLLIIVLLIIGWNVVYPAYFAGNAPQSSNMQDLPDSPQKEYIYITVESPTQTPVPTYTPYPTQTPRPTQTPVIVYTSTADSAYRTWMPRILLFVGIGFAFWSVYHYYKLKQHEIDRNFELEMTHIKAQESVMKMQSDAKIPAPRPINFNVHRGSGGENYLITAFDKKVPHNKVKDFVENVEWMGLSINQWKARDGWSQQDIEDILDHLESIQLLHPRQPGKAASWRREVDAEHLARMLGIKLDIAED